MSLDQKLCILQNLKEPLHEKLRLTDMVEINYHDLPTKLCTDFGVIPNLYSLKKSIQKYPTIEKPLAFIGHLTNPFSLVSLSEEYTKSKLNLNKLTRIGIHNPNRVFFEILEILTEFFWIRNGFSQTLKSKKNIKIISEIDSLNDDVENVFKFTFQDGYKSNTFADLKSLISQKTKHTIPFAIFSQVQTDIEIILYQIVISCQLFDGPNSSLIFKVNSLPSKNMALVLAILMKIFKYVSIYNPMIIPEDESYIVCYNFVGNKLIEPLIGQIIKLIDKISQDKIEINKKKADDAQSSDIFAHVNFGQIGDYFVDILTNQFKYYNEMKQMEMYHKHIENINLFDMLKIVKVLSKKHLIEEIEDLPIREYFLEQQKLAIAYFKRYGVL